MTEIRMRRTPPAGYGETLAAARRRSGLGLRETARRVGITSGYLAALEAGRRLPSVTIAGRLADTLTLEGDPRAFVLAAAVTDAGRDHPSRRSA